MIITLQQLPTHGWPPPALERGSLAMKSYINVCVCVCVHIFSLFMIFHSIYIFIFVFWLSTIQQNPLGRSRYIHSPSSRHPRLVSEWFFGAEIIRPDSRDFAALHER